MARNSTIKCNAAGSAEDTSTKAEPSASATTEDTDETISITSTPYDSDDSQTEYFVEDILDQDDDMDGVTKYLVRWTGYPLEKCTWEPAENMGPDLLRDLWEKKKKKRNYQPFDISLFYGALAQKEGRHFRRNLKRKRLGLPQTPPFLEEDKPEAETTTTSGKATGLGETTVLETTEPASEKPADTELLDITQDSDEDLVVIEDLSAPAVPKKKKKMEQDMAKAKDKTKGSSKPATKAKNTTEVGTSRPTDKTTAASASPSVRRGQSKELEKQASIDGTRKSSSTEPAPVAPKATAVVSRRLSDQSASASLPKTSLVEEIGAPSKAGPSSKTDAHDSRTFSAKKSSKPPQETGNAFNSGKKIRTRPKLISVMSDPTKPQQLFSSRRTLRIAELQERDKPDGVIEPSRLTAQLFPISKGPPSTPAAPSTPANVSLPRENLPTNVPPTASSILVSEAPERKKSVRFSNIGDDEAPPVTRIRLISPPIGSLVADDYGKDMFMHQQPARDTIPMPNRIIQLLTGGQKDPLSVVLSVMAHAESTQALLDEVLEGNILPFNYTCLADTLLQQLEGIRQKVLFYGNITANPTAPASGESLDTISQRLRTMTGGLVLLKSAVAILLYPTQCEQWSEERFGFPILEAVEKSAALRCIVFSTRFEGSSLLRPPRSAACDFEIPREMSEREHLMRLFLGLDRTLFTRFFPLHDDRVTRNAFLVFPPALLPFMQQLALWIHAIDPDCSVFCSTVDGAWMAFCDKMTKRSEEGVVVIHELVARAIWRFPGLNRLVGNGACNFWSLSQSILLPPLFVPTRNHGNSEPDSIPLLGLGRLSWTQLFAGGVAVFVTPSFIVSEPQRAYDLLRWVSEAHQAGNILITLVATWDLCGYLRKVADEKYRLLKEIQKDEDLQTKSIRMDTATRNGASVTDCQLRYDTWLLASEICETQATEFFEPIEYADKAIHGDDEQSLVNWFGWWSATHAGRYRLFHVVGSDLDLKRKSAGRAKRKIQVPSFVPGTVADPDVAWERMRNDTLYQSEGPSQSPENTPSAVRSAIPPSATQSQLFHEASPSVLNAHLMEYSQIKAFWRIYGFPVYWKDSNEAFKYGSLHPGSQSMDSWFSFVWPFSYKKFFRTYIGLFYMVDDSCDEAHAKQGEKLLRHPFVVVYRPVNPHMPSYEETELIYWDFRAKSKFRSRDILYAEDLSSRQRAVIEFIREKGPSKNTNMPLSRVYIGGEPFKPNDMTRSVLSRRREYGAYRDNVSLHVNELDATMEYLDALACDFRTAMPPSEVYLEARGFKVVKMRGEEKLDKHPYPGQNGPEATAQKNENNEREQPKQGDDANVIFHAPRGGHVRHIGSSKCRNRFYDVARQQRVQNPQRSTMEFEFHPTMEWYHDQEDEGRGFEHIHVGSWKDFFKTFGVTQ